MICGGHSNDVSRKEITLANDMNSRTVEGLLAFWDYLKEKHFLGTDTVGSWKTAITKVFEGVDGEDYLAVDLASVDMEAHLRRFQVAEGRKYNPDTITIYGRRIRNAIDAQQHYIETGQVPTFKTGGTKSQNGGTKSQNGGTASKAKRSTGTKAVATEPNPPSGDLIEFPFPLRTGQMARFHLPAQGLHPKDVDRASAFLRSLQFEEQKQIPERTGEEEIAA